MDRPEPLKQPKICPPGHLCASAIVSAFQCAFAILTAAFANNNNFHYTYYPHPPLTTKKNGPCFQRTVFLGSF